jgi:hypothetical protein
MPAILTAWEAEIGNIILPGQPGQKRFLDLISTEKSWALCFAPVIKQ